MEDVLQRARREEAQIQAASGSLVYTFLSVAVVALGPLSFGYALGYTSPAEAQIAATQLFTPGQLSIFDALVNVGAITGAAVSGWLSDTLGRKGALSLACYPFVAGWICIMAGHTANVLMLGRFLTGLGVGIVSNVVPVYIADVAPPKLRGTLGATNQLGITLGILLVYLLGLESIGLTYRDLAFAATCPLALLLVATYFIPESPRWLCAKGKKEAAAAALRVLRGSQHIGAELHDLQTAALETASLPPATPADFFQRRSLSGPLTVSLSLMAFQQFTGVNAVIFNSTGIFQSAGVRSAGTAALCVAVLQVVVTAVSVVLMDLAGRRPLLLTAALGMGVSSVVLGVALRSQQGIVAVGAMLAYIAFFSIGMGPIPWLIMSEVFPAYVRGTASSLATLTNWSCAFLVTLTFARMNKELGSANTFFLYGAVCGLSALFVYIMLPETKGRSLEEIGALFEDRGEPVSPRVRGTSGGAAGPSGSSAADAGGTGRVVGANGTAGEFVVGGLVGKEGRSREGSRQSMSRSSSEGSQQQQQPTVVTPLLLQPQQASIPSASPPPLPVAAEP